MGKLADLAAGAAAAGRLLRERQPDWDAVEAELVEPLRWLSTLTPTDQAHMEPFLVARALEAVTATWVALESHARTDARLAVERLRQTLGDMVEAGEVDVTTDRQELVRWIVAQLPDVSGGDLAKLAGTSTRSWQRWVAGEAEPRGEQVDRIRAVAQVLAHLRHVLTPAGCVAWLQRPHPALGDTRPAGALADPLRQREVIDAAAGARVSSAA